MKKGERVAELDGIRGIAILMVLVWHYVHCQLPVAGSQGFVRFLALGTSTFYRGVDLFFVLSGFLIGGILIDNYKANNFFAAFYLRRVCRIFPAYALLLLASGAAAAFLPPARFSWLTDNTMPIFSYITFTQNIWMGLRETYGSRFLGVTWALAVENQFYVLAPALLFLLGRRNWLRVIPALVLAALVLRFFYSGFATFVNTPFRMDSLFLGVCTAFLVRNDIFQRLDNSRRFVMPLLLTAQALLMVGAFTLFGTLAWFDHTLYAILFALAVVVVYQNRNSKYTGILRNSTLCFFGLISYGLYLYHQPVAGLLHGAAGFGVPKLRSPAHIALTAAAAVCTVALATASYFWFEKKFFKFGHRIKYRFDMHPVQQGKQ